MNIPQLDLQEAKTEVVISSPVSPAMAPLISARNRSDSRMPKIITLNVGGTLFSTMDTTLNQRILSKEHKLMKIISGQEKMMLDQHGYIFIDRKEKPFRYILDYLRNLGVARKCTFPPEGSQLREEIITECIEYYQLYDLAIYLIPRANQFDRVYCSPSLKISENGLTAYVKVPQQNCWFSARSLYPIVNDKRVFENCNRNMAEKLNRFSVCIDRDITVFAPNSSEEFNSRPSIDVTPPPAPPNSKIMGANHLVQSNSGPNSPSRSMEPREKRLSLKMNSSGKLPAHGSVLNFQTVDKTVIQGCKLQLGVVNQAYSWNPVNQALIEEKHETLQPIKSTLMYACPINGDLKASDRYGVYFDANSKELIFYRNDNVVYKYMNAENILGNAKWYFVVCFQAMQKDRFVTICPN